MEYNVNVRLSPPLSGGVSCTSYKMVARTTSTPLYSEIARENANKMASFEMQVGTLKTHLSKTKNIDRRHELTSELMTLERELAKSATIVIVFSAIAIESYIYDYAARCLSDKFVQNYLDKLDTISKLVIIPRLITGRELPHGKRWLGLAKNLIKARNSIVHSKSSEVAASADEAKRYLQKLENIDESYMQAARQAVEVLDVLVVEFSILDPTEAVWVESYLAEKFRSPLEEAR